MTKDEAMKLAQEVCPYFDEQLQDAFYEGFIRALDQFPDTTKMIEPDMGIDRGAWDDVPDATKWVDELRGGDEEPSDDDAAWSKHLKEPMSEKRVHESDTIVPSDYSGKASDYSGKAGDYSGKAGDYSGKAGDYTEQEPVAWLDIDEYEAYSNSEIDEEAKTDLTPLYLAPPKREWVGLTDEEIDYIWGITKPDYEDLFDFPRAIEAKLREKNGY